MFNVDCREMRDSLSGKHTEIANQEIELIAKRARTTNAELLKTFKEMQEIIEKVPSNIEELTEIKQYMEKVPIEIKKLKPDMDACLEIYGVLDEFNYKFESDEDFNLKWKLFGSPKDTLERIGR